LGEQFTTKLTTIVCVPPCIAYFWGCIWASRASTTETLNSGTAPGTSRNIWLAPGWGGGTSYINYKTNGQNSQGTSLGTPGGHWGGPRGIWWHILRQCGAKKQQIWVVSQRGL